MPAAQTRDAVLIAGRPVLHSTAQRDFVCRCGSRLRTVCADGQWQTVCAANPAHPPSGFMPSALFERIRARQIERAPDVLAGLPAHLRSSIRGGTMPIKNLTNQPISFPEIGRLHKGAKKTDPRRPGADLTYFRMANISDQDDVEAAFAAVYGPEPRIVNVLLPFAAIDDNWDAWQEEYVAGGLVHRCDGETMVRWRKPNGDYSDEPRPCPYASGEKQRTADRPGCVPEGRLRIIIPELKRLAYVTVSTHSKNDIAHLDSQLRALAGDGERPRDLRGIPLILYRRPYNISTPEIYPKDHAQAGQRTGRRIRRVKWLLSIEAAPTWTALLFDAQQRSALPGADGRLALPSGEVIDGATGEVIAPEEALPGEEWTDEENDEEELPVQPVTPPPVAKSPASNVEPAGPSPAPASPKNGKCPICKAAGGAHAPWCQEQDGQRIDTRAVERKGPSPAPETKAQTQTPTRAKLAGVKTSRWQSALETLAKAVPYYAKDGRPDGYHALGVALKAGYTDITAENLDAVLDYLSNYARDKQSAQSLVDADGNLLPAS